MDRKEYFRFLKQYSTQQLKDVAHTLDKDLFDLYLAHFDMLSKPKQRIIFNEALVRGLDYILFGNHYGDLTKKEQVIASNRVVKNARKYHCYRNSEYYGFGLFVYHQAKLTKAQRDTVFTIAVGYDKYQDDDIADNRVFANSFLLFTEHHNKLTQRENNTAFRLSLKYGYAKNLICWHKNILTSEQLDIAISCIRPR